MRTGLRATALIGMAVFATGCATGLRSSGRRAAEKATGPAWPVVTREHADLWLHGYAMITRDEAQVPVFRRGYRDSVEALRRRDKVVTSLDANHAKLAMLMAQNPEIANGQFLPLYFNSWDDMARVINAFVRAGGNLRDADPASRGQFALVASMFPTVQDREWLQLFTQSLEDESAHFYHQYWIEQEQARRPVVVEVDSLWQSLRPRFQAFLTHTQQLNGQLVLSLVLGGEGRTVNESPEHNILMVTLPESRNGTAEAIYGFAHEAVQTIANTAINDNTTAADQRSGIAGGYAPTTAVRGAAMLMDRVAPEFLDGFMRFYLRQAGVTPPATNVEATFTSTFPLPTAIVADMSRQINTALGGT